MPLGMDVGLSPADFVLDGNQSPSPKREQSRKFLEHGTVVIGLFKYSIHSIFRKKFNRTQSVPI